MRPGQCRTTNNSFVSKSAVMLFLFQFILFAFVCGPAFAGGKLTGKVVDSETGEPIIGVSVYLEGTKIGAASDLDGNFFIKRADAGTYSLMVSSVGYNMLTIADVVITDEETLTLNLSLEPKSIEGKKIVVTA